MKTTLYPFFTFRPDLISVILVETSHPGNIGSVTRAMDNMGVFDLRLVNPCPFYTPEAFARAGNSAGLLERCRVFSSLPEAVADLSFAVGTTARDIGRVPEIVSLPDLPEILAEQGTQKIGFVFGRERTGLTNEEITCCRLLSNIPTFGESSSLNLSQAVMVTLYEFSQYFENSFDAKPAPKKFAEVGEIQAMKEHLFEVLDIIGFIKPGRRKSLQIRFSDLISRSKLYPQDIRLIRGFLGKILTFKKLAKKKPD